MSRLDDILYDVAEGKDKWDHNLKPAVLLVCATMIPLFSLMPLSSWGNTKEMYNVLHPFISWMPILAFLAFRNAHQKLRTRHLRLPAALGRIALETYLLQYHMWLGDDATSLVTTGLFTAYTSPLRARWFTDLGRFLEVVILTIFFLAVATSTHHATMMLSQWIFGTSYGLDRQGRGSVRGIPSRSHVFECHDLEPGSGTNTSSSPETSGDEVSADVGQQFEMQVLDGRGRREAVASSSSTSSSATSWEGSEAGSSHENTNLLEKGNEGGDLESQGPKKKSSLLLPKVLVRVRALTARTPRLRSPLRRLRFRARLLFTDVLARCGIDAASLAEDPKPKALALASLLWLANWFYC